MTSFLRNRYISSLFLYTKTIYIIKKFGSIEISARKMKRILDWQSDFNEEARENEVTVVRNARCISHVFDDFSVERILKARTSRPAFFFFFQTERIREQRTLSPVFSMPPPPPSATQRIIQEWKFAKVVRGSSCLELFDARIRIIIKRNFWRGNKFFSPFFRNSPIKEEKKEMLRVFLNL